MHEVVRIENPVAIEVREDVAHAELAHHSARRQPNRESEVHRQFQIDPMIIGAQMQRPHVAIEMGRIDARGDRLLDLRLQLDFHLIETIMFENAGNVRPQVAASID